VPDSPSSAISPALEISDLRFRYPGSPPTAPWIIHIAALRLGAAEQLLLTGGSGTGKSTLLHLISGVVDLAPPNAGRISVAGRDIHALRGPARDAYRARHIGMVFQTFNLLHGFSALENVMAALMFSDIPAREHRSRAADLLASLGIERIDAAPDRLSVGQQQRVAVARALACSPALVLADEPTASLDPENAAAAMDLIQNACRDRNAALLCVSHDPSMSERFSRREKLEDLRHALTTRAA
jgi:ABC-type lipoprotein export system ATPase subunit